MRLGTLSEHEDKHVERNTQLNIYQVSLSQLLLFRAFLKIEHGISKIQKKRQTTGEQLMVLNYLVS